jgi:hypothetical protein
MGIKFDDNMISTLNRMKEVYDQIPNWVDGMDIDDEIKNRLKDDCKSNRSWLIRLLDEYSHE